MKQPDGTYASTPFYVKFGKIGVLRAKEKVVYIEINGVELDNHHMMLDDAGNAYFDDSAEGGGGGEDAGGGLEKCKRAENSRLHEAASFSQQQQAGLLAQNSIRDRRR